ncbi:DNA (cytosine-5)-methyltransferase 1 [Candidatus Phytoplasma solani]
MIMPKNFLSAPIYDKIREQIKIQSILDIIDFGNKGFEGVSLETINFMVDNKKKTSEINIYDFVHKRNLIQKCNYICDDKLPYWVIYRDSFFDKIYKQMRFDIFEVFRDRQITNAYLTKINEKEIENKEYIRVLRSRNISEDGKKIQNIKNYDTYMHNKYIDRFDIIKKIKQKKDVYMVPNMSYKPRIIKRDLEQIANGSIAFLIPKSQKIKLKKEDMEYIAHQDFRNFYQIARNKQKLTLNIDKNSVFWFGKKRRN